MGEMIANDPNRFSDTIQNYEAAYRTLERDYETVVRLMQRLNQMWSGQAHEEMVARFQQDQRLSEEVLGVVKEILGDLKNASEEYLKCDGNVKSIVDSIRI